MKAMFDYIVSSRGATIEKASRPVSAAQTHLDAILKQPHRKKNSLIDDRAFIYHQDLKNLGLSTGFFMTESDISSMMAEGDPTKSGRMSFEDFERVMKKTVYLRLIQTLWALK